jgi:hypothetical protein
MAAKESSNGLKGFSALNPTRPQYALFNMHAKFLACLDDDFTDTLTHLTAHNFVTVFCCPDDVKSVIKFGMASCGIDHNLPSHF